MINDIKQSMNERMEKSVEALQGELAKLRTGRAHPSLLEQVMVPYYGTDTPLMQVANIAVSDPRTLAVTPWEKPLIPVVEKAIISADLGLNPTTSGDTIRVPLPPLNEERRKELVRIVKQEAENARVAVRNIRRDGLAQLKDLVKDKAISEDDERRGQDEVQKITDKFVAQIDEMVSHKETDLMAV